MMKTGILRCTRPPQRHNSFLKTSVCADGSHHVHETNRIYSFYTKTLKENLWKDIFIFLWLFGVFSCLKTFFLDFHPGKLSCNADV